MRTFPPLHVSPGALLFLSVLSAAPHYYNLFKTVRQLQLFTETVWRVRCWGAFLPAECFEHEF